MVVVLLVCCVGIVLAAKTCPSCGTENRDDAKFCKSCGTRLPESEPRYTPSIPRVKADVSVSGSNVTVTSEPSGATVEIDGTVRGQTPLDVSGLQVGRHSIAVSRSGYREYTGTFSISGQVGTLVVTTEPTGAQVWIDGEYRGTSTATGLAVPRLAFGTHRVVARLSGHSDASRDVELSTVGPIAVNLRLGAGKGFLNITTNPSGAEVVANGKRLGQTNATFELLPDRYVLMLNRPGYEDWVGYAQVTVAETSYIRESLVKLKTPKLPLLIAGAALLLGGGACAMMGEQSYASYRSATRPIDVERYRQTTETWDLYRNIALGGGVVLCGSYFVLRW